MPAAATDYFMKAGFGTATTLSSPGYTIGNASINVASTTNWPTDTGVTFAIDETELVDGEYVRVDGTYNVFRGTVDSATQITNLTYVGGDANRNYSAAATTRVYILVSSYLHNRVVDGLLVSHDQDGSLKAGSVDTAAVIGDNIITPAKLTDEARKGWVVGQLAAPNTITYNGNGSYVLVFNSVDYTDEVSEGMRLRTTRTVAAPTQCADLEASSSQYFNDTSVSGMSFTDDFVAGAWIKVESYQNPGYIISRYNGTSGWGLQINTNGQVLLVGFNAGSGNNSQVYSQQAVPLGKWVHVAAQLDMSAFTATSTTSYIMINGVDVPAVVARTGTNPTALVQAGNFEVGSANAASFFDGKIAQVFVSSAKITQANVRTIMTQGITASDVSTHSIVSAYSLSNSLTDINTTSANNLTAQNSAAATATDSPFGEQSDGSISSTLDYAVITKKAFSTNTTLTVQVPEGCTIPTSGGVSAVAYSTQSTPYGFPLTAGRWTVESHTRTLATQSSPTAGTWYNLNSVQLNIPVGSWDVTYRVLAEQNRVAGSIDIRTTLSTANNTEIDRLYSIRMNSNAALTDHGGLCTVSEPVNVSSATTYYLNTQASNSSAVSLYNRGDASTTIIKSTLSYVR